MTENPFTDNFQAVLQMGSDLFDELSIQFLEVLDEDARQTMRSFYSGGYTAGFAAGQRDIAQALDRLNQEKQS